MPLQAARRYQDTRHQGLSVGMERPLMSDAKLTEDRKQSGRDRESFLLLYVLLHDLKQKHKSVLFILIHDI